MPNIPAMPTPEGLSGQPIPTGWFADMWRVVDALRRAEQLRGLDTGDGRGRRERTAALVKMTSATVGNVYLTSSSARETGATIKEIDGMTLIAGAWYLALWMDIAGGSYWTAVRQIGPDVEVPIIDVGKANETNGATGMVIGTFSALSDSASYDVVLSTEDFRCRHIEAWITEPVATSSATPTTGNKFAGHAPPAAVDLVAEGVYTVYVATNGHLKVRGSAASLNTAVIWIRASGRVCSPCACPEGLEIEYVVSNALASPLDSATIFRRLVTYDSLGCSGDVILIEEFRLVSPLVVNGSPCSWVGAGNWEVRTDEGAGMSPWFEVGTANLTLSLTSCIWQIANSQCNAVKSTGNTPVGILANDCCIDSDPVPGQSLHHTIAAEVTEVAP